MVQSRIRNLARVVAAIPAPAGGGDHADPVADRGCRARSGPAQPGHQRVARVEAAIVAGNGALGSVAGDDAGRGRRQHRRGVLGGAGRPDRRSSRRVRAGRRCSRYCSSGCRPGCRSAGPARSRSPPSRRSCGTRSPPRTGSPGRIPRCATPTVAFLCAGLVVGRRLPCLVAPTSCTTCFPSLRRRRRSGWSSARSRSRVCSWSCCSGPSPGS